jgi:ABC-type multidrug transport system fused ATPase/permease subunit
MPDRSLFSRLYAGPAEWLIIIGLALTLFTHIIPSFKDGALESARVRVETAEEMLRLDMKMFEREQEAERRKLNADPNLAPDERQKQEQAMKDSADRMRKDLEQKNDTMVLQRDYLRAKASAAGTRVHLLFGWTGRLLLLAGLLAITFMSEGTQQKVVLVVLLVVLFSSLAGANLSIFGGGQFGDSSEMVRQLKLNR